MDPKKLPGNTPLKFYRNRRHGFSMLYPDWWHEFDLTEAEGKLYSPSATDHSTCLMVEVRDLGTRVTARDLPTLREGFLAGLRRVPGSKIESHVDYDVGFLIGLEARQTYREGGARRKRWVRVLYKDTLQVRLVAQGATAREFDFWLPSFNPAMTGFVFDGGFPPVPEVAPAPGGAHAG
jgi:hypothetical protein